MADVAHPSAPEGVEKFNFGPCSGRDSIVFGSERPGMKAEYDKPEGIPQEAVAEWVSFMKEKGVTRVMSLLSEKELGYYQTATPLRDTYASEFKSHEMLDMKAEGAKDKAIAFLEAAAAAGEKAVLHCAGGQGRTGTVLGAWMMHKYELSVEDSIKEIEDAMKAGNFSRWPKAEKISAFVADGHL